MTQVSISLPTELQRHVDARVEHGGFADRGDYLRALVERDQRTYAAEVARVQGLIDAGLASRVIERDAIAVLDEIIAGDRRPHG